MVGKDKVTSCHLQLFFRKILFMEKTARSAQFSSTSSFSHMIMKEKRLAHVLLKSNDEHERQRLQKEKDSITFFQHPRAMKPAKATSMKLQDIQMLVNHCRDDHIRALGLIKGFCGVMTL